MPLWNHLAQLLKRLNFDRGTALCHLFHVFLILLYTALVVVASRHYEHGLNYSFTPARQSIMSATVSVVAQTFSTLYLAVLVLLTQRLALIRDLHTRQTLTAIHDKSNAWLGLGSSLLTLIDQMRIPASVWSITAITAYLGGIAALHITIPASVAVNSYNTTEVTLQTTQLARPQSLNLNKSDAASWDILNVYGQFSQLGLRDNMVYDIIPVTSLSVGNATVNATVFDVHCGTVPRLHQLQSDAENPWKFAVSSIHSFFTTPIALSFRLSPLLLEHSSLPEFSLDALPVGLPNALVVTSTIPVTDDLGTSAVSFKIDPAVSITRAGANQILDSVQVFACNINSMDTTIEVSAITRQPIEPQLPRGATTWQPWSPSKALLDPLLENIYALSVNAPTSSRIMDAIEYYIVNNTKTMDEDQQVDLGRSINVGFPPMLDQFIMEDLMIAPSSLARRSSFLLSDFQSSLSKAVAAVVWYERNRNNTDVHSFDPSSTFNDQLLGQTAVEVGIIRIRLNFNVIPLAIGLGVSCAIFALTFILSKRPARLQASNSIDAAGILQLTWLLGNDYHFSEVKTPERQVLRKAGLFDVQMSTWAEQKAGAPHVSGDDTSELTRLTAVSH